jgi:hypothetical protein
MIHLRSIENSDPDRDPLGFKNMSGSLYGSLIFDCHDYAIF